LKFWQTKIVMPFTPIVIVLVAISVVGAIAVPFGGSAILGQDYCIRAVIQSYLLMLSAAQMECVRALIKLIFITTKSAYDSFVVVLGVIAAKPSKMLIIIIIIAAQSAAIKSSTNNTVQQLMNA
jgi:hypothetical protein